MNVLVGDATRTKTVADTRPSLRVVIVGHVDHGKSTLIGRLLHETGNLPDGKLEQLKAVAKRRGMPFEWAFLLDALQTERDQGITIDTSQIRFRTPSRDIVLIDAPGHTEFLRNMITGASQADAALLIVDAAEGVREQTRRHGYLLQLLGVHQIAIVVNKMDRIDYDAARFDAIKKELTDHLGSLGLTPSAIIPISARHGDGVARRSDQTRWYDGPTVLEIFERFNTAPPADKLPLRFPVQAIYKFDDRRIIAGRVETGRLTVGETITVTPSGKQVKVRAIESWPVPIESNLPLEARAGQSVGITLDQEIFLQRGDVISAAQAPIAATLLRARVFWLHEIPLESGIALTVRIGTSEARATITGIPKAVDPGALETSGHDTIRQNNVGEILIALATPLAADTYDANPQTGRVVLDLDGRIAGGGLILAAEKTATIRPVPVANNIVPVASAVSADERAQRFGHGGAVIWFTGLPASGKSTLARALERHLFDRGGSPILLDGDTVRGGLNSDLRFSTEDRAENVRRLAEVAAHLARSGAIAIVAAVSPSAADRKRARNIAGKGFFEIHVATQQKVCEERDPKNHYRKARSGQLADFTGVTSQYESPADPDLRIDTAQTSTEGAVRELARLLQSSGILRQRA
ncbi:MAG TPA: adenylyl-sulfate kinase [Pseudorhodoplanes sp.]|nr:adenylyl-sulfate kinase [Pseudorhodoplanes sp.]